MRAIQAWMRWPRVTIVMYITNKDKHRQQFSSCGATSPSLVQGCGMNFSEIQSVIVSYGTCGGAGGALGAAACWACLVTVEAAAAAAGRVAGAGAGGRGAV